MSLYAKILYTSVKYISFVYGEHYEQEIRKLYIYAIANIETRLFLFIHALCKCRIEINQNKPNTFDNLVFLYV